MTSTLSLPLLDVEPVRPTFAQGPRDLSSVRLLRMSLTDRCNLRCVYCMPAGGVAFDDAADLLSADDLVAVAEAAASIGVDHLKLTGGEPTVRRDLVELVTRMARIPGVRDLSLTTNGLTLDRLASPLRDAGLDRLTVSWDSMQPERLARLTGAVWGDAVDPARARRAGEDLLHRLHAGLDAAGAAGFDRLKINVVVIGGLNDDEAADFARLTLSRPWTVRFIEYMPLGDSQLIDEAQAATVDNAAVFERIQRELGPLTPVDRSTERGVGPASVFRLDGAPGRVGFISAMSQPFCEACNRLRLTARGELRSCLFDGGEVDLKPSLKLPEASARRNAILAAMKACVRLKPEVHGERGNRAMSQLGG